MNSFAILRTNVGLTTNIKIMIDSNYNLSLDSIESNQDLCSDKFKKVKFNKKNYYDELVSFFYKNLPSDIAYQIKYDNDVDTMYSDFSKQYDEIYQYGARNIIDNKNYTEEYEYFAPLYIDINKIPSNFIIFRVDGAGIDTLNKENFTNDILKKFKTVKLFDMSKKTQFGEWLDNNFLSNSSFPHTPLEIDFRELEFCKWNGIDYETGGYTSKSFFIDDFLEKEKEIFELEKFIFNSYKSNKVVFPNIMNFSFLFDDNPSTPELKKKWSINRYYGFYLNNLELVKTISPYITPFLKEDVIVKDGNILTTLNDEDPFVLGWSSDRPFYIEYNGGYYKVERFTEILENQLMSLSDDATSIKKPKSIDFVDSEPKKVIEQYVNLEVVKYRIISDINLSGKQSELNKNYGVIDSSNNLIDYYGNYIKAYDDFDKYSIWLIEIDGIYHNLFNDNGNLKLSTDYSFGFNLNDYTYKVGGVESKISFIVDNENTPKSFKIYRAIFTDIKDFDNIILDTEYSKFEYEIKDEVTKTDETKMYVDNLLTKTDPKEIDDFIYKGEVIHIPVSSEYTANYETFKIEKNQLSDIWRKNPVYCRWGFQNSLSANDYPYLLNNSLLFEDFNRTTNTFDPDPKRIERNLDYFYTINSSTSSYIHHTLHIEGFDEFGNLNTDYKFELDKYLGLATYSLGTSSTIATYSSDYFTDFFYQRQLFSNGEVIKNCKKYSEFNRGDVSVPNISLFRGLKFLVYDVDSIDLSKEGEINSINLSNSNKFDGYKLSILLSDNDTSVDSNGKLINSNNEMQWEIIDHWKMDKFYKSGSIVSFDDVLYKSNSDSMTDYPENIQTFANVKSAPYNQTEWDYHSPTYSIFWKPNKLTYDTGDYVYNNGDYYYCASASNAVDFWNPIGYNSYSLNKIVLFKGDFYKSNINNNQYPPDVRTPVKVGSNMMEPWSKTTPVSSKWLTVELWSSISKYKVNKLVTHNDTLWKCLKDVESGEEPGVSIYWSRLYSLVPDTEFVYDENQNSVIEMNDSYYLCKSNVNKSTLDNGVIIYVNKKHKNILININISDNTLPNVKNTNRDDLYTEIYKKLTAVNFMTAVNDIDTKYGFTDYVTYILINEDGTITKHNYKNNLNSLTCLVKVEEPDELNIKSNSLKRTVIDNPKSLKAVKLLKDGNVRSLEQINWYSDLPYTVSISEDKNEPSRFTNYHGGKNIINNQIFRHGGYYMPIFYDIQLFDKQLDGLSSNTKFDTTLTEFGLIKERKIQKINRTGSILKLKGEKDTKSIYPMLDEFGYTVRDFFIFSSTWDLRYHYETYKLNYKPKFNIELPTIESDTREKFGQTIETITENRKNINL